MSRPPTPIPDSLPHPVFTTAEARQAGMSSDRLRAQDLRHLAYGLHARRDVEITETAILTALTRSDPMAVARGLSAARYWALPLPWAKQSWVAEPVITPIHMTASGHVRRDTGPVRWNRQRLGREEIVTAGDLRVTDRVRTWLDLAQILTLDQLVQIGDHLVRIPRPGLEHRDEPHATRDQLTSSVSEHPGPGRPLLRRAAALVQVGSDSPAETVLRLAARRADLPAPVLNARQHCEGYDLGEPDLAWPEWKVCVEHEGPTHLTPSQQERDIARRERRETLGWIEVQTVAADLRDECDRGVLRMKRALTRQGWRPQ